MEKLFFFITPNIKKTHSNNPEDGQCWRMCGNMSAGHFHIFWECPIISLYWIEVVKVIRSIFGSELEFNFSVIYLGNLSTALRKADRYLLQIVLAGSKKAITSKWLSKVSQTIAEWIEIVKEIYVMGHLTFSLRHARKKCEAYLEKWISYLNTN